MSLPLFKILLVDHAPAKLEQLIDYLSRFNYQVDVAENGFSLLEQVTDHLPDLILLKVPLHNTDSFALCKKIKADPKIQHLPVIFLSLSNETAAKVKGFEVGGVDYIVEPFAIPEVLARIQAHLTLAKELYTLQQENIKLQQYITGQALQAQNRLRLLPDVRKPQESPQIKLSLLGTFRLFVNNEERTNFRSDMVRALLAYLAVEGQAAIDRTWLAQFFWPDNLPHTRLNSLRVALHNLRQVLSPLDELLVTDHRKVMFQAKHTLFWCDAVDIEHGSLLNRPKRNMLPGANRADHQLSTVAFLAGLDSIHSHHFQEWRRNQQAFYAQPGR